MAIAAMILVIAVIFGLCFLVDKGFTKLFRNKVQHQTGKSVRLNKRYGSIGLIMFAFGVAAVFMGINNEEWVLVGGAALLVLGGIALVTYYMSFGIYYDEDSFILSQFGKSGAFFYFKDICKQQLYLASGNVVVELHMNDGRHFQVHTGMAGMDAFMDHAFKAWLEATGRTQEECDWYDPEKSCWFPREEE